MAKLPDATDLGGMPSLNSRRPIAGYDVSAIAHAGEQLGEAMATGGQMIGRAIAKGGTELGQAEAEGGTKIGQAIAKAGTLEGDAIAGGGVEIGKGLQTLGTGTQHLATGITHYVHALDNYDLTRAEAAHEIKIGKLKDKYADDKDFTTMPQRFAAELEQINSEVEDGMSSRVQGRYRLWADPRDVHLVSLIKGHARGIERDISNAKLADDLTTLAENSLRNPDPLMRTGTLDLIKERIDAQQGRGFITAVQAQALRQRTTIGYVEKTFDIMPPEQRIAALSEPRGSGKLIDMLPEDTRIGMLQRAKAELYREGVDVRAQFQAQVQDTEAEAMRSGAVVKPIPVEQFKKILGDDVGQRAFDNHQANVTLGADIAVLSGLDPAQRRGIIDSYAPDAGGPGGTPPAKAGQRKLVDSYAAQAKRQDILIEANRRIEAEIEKDPANYAITRLPIVSAAWKTLGETLSDKKATPEAKAAAARDFVAKTQAEQAHIWIDPTKIAILPQGYVTAFNSSLAHAADNDDPQARFGLIARVQQEAQIWGDAWPAVMRQLAPTAQPIVRAIAAGADPGAMTRILSLGKDESPGKVLKEQNETKFRDMTTALNETMAPFRRTIMGRQLDRDYTGYYSLAEKLAALYVRDGDSATDAAAKAFAALIGNRYEFRDTYRIPKSISTSPDDIQAGTVVARSAIETAATTGADAFGIAPFVDDEGLGGNNRADSLGKFARDGKWVTAPGNDGLNLIYESRRGSVNVVRTNSGAPLLLTWKQLAALGGTADQRAKATFDVYGGGVSP